jgi:hypothetical protein
VLSPCRTPRTTYAAPPPTQGATLAPQQSGAKRFASSPHRLPPAHATNAVKAASAPLAHTSVLAAPPVGATQSAGAPLQLPPLAYRAAVAAPPCYTTSADTTRSIASHTAQAADAALDDIISSVESHPVASPAASRPIAEDASGRHGAPRGSEGFSGMSVQQSRSHLPECLPHGIAHAPPQRSSPGQCEAQVHSTRCNNASSTVSAAGLSPVAADTTASAQQPPWLHRTDAVLLPACVDASPASSAAQPGTEPAGARPAPRRRLDFESHSISLLPGAAATDDITSMLQSEGVSKQLVQLQMAAEEDGGARHSAADPADPEVTNPTHSTLLRECEALEELVRKM